MRNSLVLCLLCIGQTAYANTPAYQEARVLAGRLEVKVEGGRYVFRPYAEGILETSFNADGQAALQASHAVHMSIKSMRTHFKQDAQSLDFSAGGVRVHIQKSPFQISYFYQQRLLITERAGYHQQGEHQVVDFALDANEALYGGGARALSMNRRGFQLPLYNKAHYGYEEHSTQMNFALPLVLSSKLYALHFDEPATGYLDLDSGRQNNLRFASTGSRKTYQIIAADNWLQLCARYTQLTGRQPLPPRWALGNFASRFGYHSQAEAETVLARFQAEKIPLDAIVFDLYWFGKVIKGSMGNLAFDLERFPAPQKMIADFKAQGVNTVLISEPFILTTSKRWPEAVEQNILAKNAHGQPYRYDFYFGNTGLIDITHPPARTWLWQRYRELKSLGVAGWWGDLGEPEVHPEDMRHQAGSAAEVHNIYGHEWARLIAQGYARDFPQQRPFILMRAGYSGSQKFGMIPWSGDVNRSWGGLRAQPALALQMGMQGLAYMHSDLGGFAGTNLDDELYVRWLQYGVFQPIFRPHAQEEVPSEPVFRADAAKVLAKAAIALRYRLLPYNYTLAYLNHARGWPLMRPLLFNEASNSALYNDARAYLWGEDFLVHPIVQAGQTEAEVYFPKSDFWFDFASGTEHAPGSRACVALSADKIPVFVRAGAFIPMRPGLHNTATYSTREFELHYYHHPSVARSAGLLYDDDGLDPHSAASQLRFNSRASKHCLQIGLSEKAAAQYRSMDRKIQLVVHQIAQQPKAVRMRGQTVPFVWDAAQKLIRLEIKWQKKRPVQLELLWNAN